MAKQLKRVEVEAYANSHLWTVWASRDDSVSIGLLPGVMRIGHSSVDGKYDMWVDIRYDLEELKSEILALNNQEDTDDGPGF